MTTIAYRDGVLAADSRVSSGGAIRGENRKIVRTKHGLLAGAVGSAAYAYQFLAWVMKGARGKPPACPADSVGFIFGAARVPVRLFETDGEFSYEAPYFAFGSGGPEARGAMFAGADAETAVRAGIALDAGSGGPVTVLRHDHA